MDKIPEVINSVIRSGSILIDYHGVRHICYTVNEGEETETNIHVNLPEFKRPQISPVIDDESRSFVNGYKVVKMNNGEYAYLRERDKELLPYRYDVAFDFNEHGFAIVGKDGSVSWIDKDFNYLNLEGQMVKENLEEQYHSDFAGWQEVCSFSKGDIPLSRVYDGRRSIGMISYFGTDGKIKKFNMFDGYNLHWYSTLQFSNGTSFNENGQAFADDKILFAKGYYLKNSDLIKLAMESGFVDSISEKADTCYEQEFEKKLTKK